MTMTDDRPRGSCVIPDCPRDPYRRDDGRVPLVCGPDVSRMRHWLTEMPQLVDELAARDAPEEVTARADVRPLLAGWHPPLTLALEQLTVASALPAAVVGVAGRGGRVSGTTEPRLPISVDAVDLHGPARSTRRIQGEDDIGYLPVASTLDFWVQDLRDHRGRGEGLPEPSVTVLAGWLLERIDEAADDWLPVDEFFEDLRRAHGALRGQLGLIDVPDYRKGVPCSKCSALSLVRQADWVICSACGAYLKITEYEEYTLTLATAVSAEEREKRRRAAVERRAVVRLLKEMHAAGWRHRMHWCEPARDEDGAPLDEGGPLLHQWHRGREVMEMAYFGEVRYGALYYGNDVVEGDDAIPSVLSVALGWVAEHGVARLHKLASAAGVLSVPREGGAQ